MPCELWVDACVPHQQATFLSLQASNLLSFVAKEPHAVAWSLDTCSTQCSPIHQVQMHGASNRDTHFYSPHNNSSFHQTTTTYVWHTGQIHNGMGRGCIILQDSTLLSVTLAPTLLEWSSQVQHGSDLTTSTPVSDVCAPACTMGYGLFCGLWVWCRRTNHRPFCPPMSPWTVQPDSSERWDNRIAAQHLPWDLMRPNSRQ